MISTTVIQLSIERNGEKKRAERYDEASRCEMVNRVKCHHYMGGKKGTGVRDFLFIPISTTSTLLGIFLVAT